MADDGEIICPICSVNLQFLPEIKRDEHCDTCLDTADFLEVRQPKRPATLENSSFNKLMKVNQEPIKRTFLEPKKEPGPPKVSKRLTKMPFYKTIDVGSATFAVDAFSYGPIPHVNCYFLSHFHSDHYGGLTKAWKNGPIYCSPATARLVNLKLGVSWEYLRPLSIEEKHTIEDVDVKLFDANHCPGAVVFLFDRRILHTGDFRATKSLTNTLLNYASSLDAIYLDTTYLDPDRAFPDQDAVVDSCAQFVEKFQSKPMPPSYFTTQPAQRKVLVCVGTYTIGKEKLAVSIANKLNQKIWAPPAKLNVLRAIGDPELDNFLSEDGTVAQVHLMQMHEVNMNTLEKKWKVLKRHFTHLIAFVPTGWTWKSSDTTFTVKNLESSSSTNVKNNEILRVCRVPYSEHSSYSELEQFCKQVSCRKLISTVHTKRYDILRMWEKGKTY